MSQPVRGAFTCDAAVDISPYFRSKLVGRAEFEMLIQLIIDDDVAVVDVPTTELHL